MSIFVIILALFPDFSQSLKRVSSFRIERGTQVAGIHGLKITSIFVIILHFSQTFFCVFFATEKSWKIPINNEEYPPEIMPAMFETQNFFMDISHYL